MSLQKDGSIIIDGNDFVQGQAVSPHVGISKLQNLEVFDVPGVARIQPQLQQSFLTTGLPTAIVRDIYGNNYVGTEDGKLYKNGAILQSGLTLVYDLAIFNDYLVVTHSTVMSLYGPLSSGGAAWFANWQSGLASGYYKKLVPGQDDILYITNGNSIASVSSFVGGTPAVTPTASWNASALDLPSGQYARTLNELGKYLAIGTQSGSSFYDSAYGVGNLYFWDRTSTSFELPLVFQESGIGQILTVGNQLIVHAGQFGNMYSTNTTSFEFLKQIQFNTNKAATCFPYPNAIAKLGNEVVVGTSTNSDGYPGSLSAHGIYTLKGKNTSLRNTISTGGYGSEQVLKIGAITSFQSGIEKTMYVGWQDGTTYGVDVTDFHPYANYVAFLESQLYTVGSRTNYKSYTQLEFQLARALIANQGIRIKYRSSLDGTWTTIGTWTTAEIGTGKTSFNTKALISSVEMLQIRVELHQSAGVQFGNNVELKRIIIS